MADKRSIQICPYLGLPNDPASRYDEPADAHRCYSPSQPGEIALDYQQAFCFSDQYSACKRFVAPPKTEMPREAEVIAQRAKSPPVSPEAHVPQKPGDSKRAAGLGVRAEFALWGLAIVLAVVAIYSSLVLFGSKSTNVALAVSTATPSNSPTATPPSTSTFTETAAPADTLIPSPASASTPNALIIPTPPSDGTVLNLSPAVNGVGWTASKELAPHWGDRDLHVGTFQGQTYTSVIQFTLGNVLPPGSKILFATLELTGRDASHLGKTGEWQLELLDGTQTRDWAEATTAEIINAPSLGSVGRPLQATELGEGLVNRFDFAQSQLQLLEAKLKIGQITLRIKGPTGDADNLFSWDAGTAGAGGLFAPTLYVVAVPGPFTVVTITPTPANVLTAAAYLVRATALAERFGTPTPFGPGVVTATPGGGRVEVTPAATPANAATAAALSAYATAVAITTGTFTPTPPNMVVVYPTATPVFISIDQLLVPPTATAVAGVNYGAIPIPTFLNGKILALSDRFGEQYANQPIVMNSDGTVSGILSSALYYQAAYARDSYSSDRQRRAVVAPDSGNPDILQIWIEDETTGGRTQITHLTRGMAYDAAWSPDGGSIAYVSTETGRAEIFVYSILNRASRQLTVTTARLVYNQRPSWSPDSSQIVFKSNRDSGSFQIWLMNADGSNMQNLSQNLYDEVDPVWVKR